MPALRDPQTGDSRRSILLAGRSIDYTLKRAKRRTLGLTIDDRGLTVAIPLRGSIRDAEDFIREKGAWVLEKLDEWAQRAPPAVHILEDGSRFPLRGRQCTLRLVPDLSQPRWLEDLYGHELHIAPYRDGVLRTLVMRAIQSYALRYFKGRVEEYAYTLQQFAPDVRIPTVRLTNANTRWGSCSKLSGIRLNWRLIHLPSAQIDYVVAHELAHLVEMNHSARFWAVVAEMYPDYDEARAALRDANRIIPAW